jgi:hypothetical protein
MIQLVPVPSAARLSVAPFRRAPPRHIVSGSVSKAPEQISTFSGAPKGRRHTNPGEEEEW